MMSDYSESTCEVRVGRQNLSLCCLLAFESNCAGMRGLAMSWWGLEDEDSAGRRVSGRMTDRRRPATGLVVVAAALSMMAPGVGGTAFWQSPTPGCDGLSGLVNQGGCCQMTSFPVMLGQKANVTVQAAMLGSSAVTISVVPGLPGTGVQNGDLEGACCGFGAFVQSLTPTTGNPAVKQADWVTPNPLFISEDSVPTDYCLSFRATHSGTDVNSACIKKFCYKLCITPMFTFGGRFMSSPNWVTDANACGLGKGPGGADRACLVLEGTAGISQRIISYLQVSKVPVLDPTDVNSLGVRVGVPVTFTVNIASYDERGVLDILIVDDPGSPIGLEAGPTSQTCAPGVKACRTMTYTPRKSQEGKTHVVRFVARNVAGAPCPVLISNELEVRIPVSVPRFSWVVPNENREKEVPVGATYEESFVCSAANYPAKVSFRSMSVNGMPAPGMGGGELVDVSNTPTTFGSVHTTLFKYTVPASDAGGVRQWCFACGDAADVMPKDIVCLSLRTRLCEYLVHDGDTLQSLARRHHLNTNWLRLWNANPSMTNPDLSLTEDSKLTFLDSSDLKLKKFHSVRVGGIYTIKRGDTLNTVAARFETTVKRLLSVNPLIAEALGDAHLHDGGIQPGMDVCILACTNKMNSRPSLFGWGTV